MQIIPDTLKRLQAFAFVDEAELNCSGHEELMRNAATHMAESGLQKILEDCIEIKDGCMGYPGQTLELNVYVLSPYELQQIIADARAQGYRDAEKLNHKFPNYL